MTKIATLLSVFLLSLTLTVSSFGQSCPSGEDDAKNKQQTNLLKNETARQIKAILDSDLTWEQQVGCIATRGERTFAKRNGVFRPETVLTEQIIDNNWVNYLFTDFDYTPDDLLAGFEFFVWNSDMADWDKDAKVLFAYDNNGFTTEFIGQVWNGSMYENGFRFLTEQDDVGNELSSLTQSWYNGDWFTDFKEVSEVENGLIVQSISQTQNSDSTMLVDFAQSLFEYDDDGREILETQQFWDDAASTFATSSQTITEYNDMSIVETSQISIDEGITWLDFSQITTMLDANGLIVENIYQLANFLTQMLEDRERTTYEYNDDDQPIEIIDFVPNGMGGWDNDEANFSTYENGMISVDLYAYWDAAGKTGSRSENTNPFSATWIDDTRDIYNYETTGTAIEDESLAQLTSFSVFPSPARNRVQLDVVLNEPATMQIEVFDILGRRVANLFDASHVANTTQRINWEADQLPAGMYLIRLTVDQKVSTRPIVLIK